jgi:hypothetical protein
MLTCADETLSTSPLDPTERGESEMKSGETDTQSSAQLNMSKEDIGIHKESNKPVSEHEIYNQILTNKIMHNMCNNTTSNVRRSVEREMGHKKNNAPRSRLAGKRSLNGRYS